MATSDLLVRLQARDEMSSSFKSAEASAKAMERALNRLEAEQRRMAQAEFAAHREGAQRAEAKIAAQQRMVRAEAAAYRDQERMAEQAAAAARQRAENQRRIMDSVGRVAMGVGAATAVGLGLSARAAISWESAWAGVRKTVDGSDAEMASLEKELRGLTKTLPATHEEIAGVAEAAGQLGVKRSDIASFTKTAIDMGESTNLSAEEAATGLAQLGNVMGVLPSEAGRAGAALVELGNNGASTERDILEMSKRIAGAGTTIGLTEAEVLGFASALSDVGINAEAGGSSISRVMIDISTAVETGSDTLDEFARVAGMSTAEFTRAFKDDAAGAVISFIEGLGGLEDSGESALVVLDNLGLSEIRVRDTLLRTAAAGDKVRESVERGSQAWEDNNALVEEAAKRYATSEARLQLARNSLNDAAIDLGAHVVPALAGAAERVAALADAFSALPDDVKGGVTALGGIVATLGLVGGAALIAVPRFAEFMTVLEGAGPRSQRLAGNLRGIGSVLAGPVGIGLAGATLALGVWANEHYKAQAAVNSLATTLDQQTAALTENTQQKVISTLQDEGAFDAAKKLGIGVGEVTKAVVEGGPALAALRAEVEGFTTNTEGAALRQTDMVGSTRENHDAAKLLTGVLGGTNEALTEAQEKVREQAQAQGALASTTKDVTATTEDMAGAVGAAQVPVGSMYDSLVTYAQALGMSEEETEALVEKTEEWGQQLAAFVDPLDAYTGLLGEKEEAERKTAQATADANDDAEDSWEDYVKTAKVTTKEYLAELREQVEAQEDWEENLLKLAGRVSEGTLDQLARLGPEGAPLVKKLTTASDKELRELDDLYSKRTKEATDASGRQLRLAQPVLAAVARKAGRGTAEALAEELAAGTKTVTQIARTYGIELADGVNPVLRGVGKSPISIGGGRYRTSTGQVLEADGGYRTATGRGENHVAQIARAGEWRVWAEDETGGEGYVPLHPAKRGRSKAVTEQIVHHFGGQVRWNADGGFWGPGDVPGVPGTGRYRAPISTAASATMEHARDAVTDWLGANGAGAIGSAGGAGGRGWQWQMAVLRAAFPGLPLNSGYRPGAVTALGNPSMHGMGRAVDVPPRMDVFNWIKANYGTSTKQLFFSPAGAILNGRPWNMDSVTRGDHWDHIHWGYANGGVRAPAGSVMNPHVRDAGGPLRPGWTVNATGGDEVVVPRRLGSLPLGAASSATAAVTAVVDKGAFADAMDGIELTLLVDGAPVRAVVRAELDGHDTDVRDRLQYAGRG